MESNKPNPEWSTKFTDKLKGLGYDGVALRFAKGGSEYVAFDSTQIKSATGNKGTFDPSNPDIRESE